MAVHPLSQKALLLQIHRAEGLPTSEPFSVTVRPAGVPQHRPLQTSTCHASNAPRWGRVQPNSRSQSVSILGGSGPSEMFELSEDELLVAGMELSLSVCTMRATSGHMFGMISSGPTQVTVAQATLHLGEEEGSLLTGLRSGQCAVLHLPLYPPQPDAPTKNTVRTSLERARSSSGADVPVRQPIAAHVSEGQAVEATQGTSEEWTDVPKSGHSSLGICQSGPAGVLVVSCWLQANWSEQGYSEQLSPDLHPSSYLPMRCLPPAGVLHSSVATVYSEPCIMLLRFRLLGVWGLSAPPGRVPTPAVRRSQTSLVTLKRHEDTKSTARQVGVRIQIQGNELLSHVGSLWGKFKNAIDKKGEQSGAQQSAKSDVKQPTQSEQQTSVQPTPYGTTQDSTLSPPQPPSPSLHTIASHPVLYEPGDTAETRSTEGAGPVKPAVPNADVLKCVVVSGSLSPSDTNHVSNVLGALEEAGFAANADLPALDSSFCWLKITCEGQQHTSRMTAIAPSCSLSQPRSATSREGTCGQSEAAAALLFGAQSPMSAAWPTEEPPALCAVNRPVLSHSHPTVEIELWGSKDNKSRGKALVKLTASVARILEAAGATHPHDSTGNTHVKPPKPPAGERLLQRLGVHEVGGVPAFMDPLAWPQGEVLVQGRLEGGAPVAVALAVEVCDADDRARMLGLPIIDTGRAYGSHQASHSPDANLQAAHSGASALSAQGPDVSGRQDSNAALPASPLAPVSSPSESVTWHPQPPVLLDTMYGLQLPPQSCAPAGLEQRRRQLKPCHVSGGTLGSLDLVLHSITLTGTNTQAEPQANQAAPKPFDCYAVIRSGTQWVLTQTKPIAFGGAPAVWGFAVSWPLIHPSQLVTLCLFRAPDQAAAARKATARVVGIQLGGGDNLIARLRFRPSQLRNNCLHAAVSLPMLGERAQSRGPQVVGSCQLSLMVHCPSLSPLVSSYCHPQTYPPLALLQLGVLPGDDCRSPFLGHEGLAVSSELVHRRRRRAALGWLGSCTPSLSHRISKRLLHDGRSDFTLSRTQANWKRFTVVLGSLRPTMHNWNVIRSWQKPWLSALTQCLVVLGATQPSRAAAVLILVYAVILIRRHFALGDALGAPPRMVEDSALEGPLVLSTRINALAYTTGSELANTASDATYFGTDTATDTSYEPRESPRRQDSTPRAILTPQHARPSVSPAAQLHHSTTNPTLRPSTLDTGFWYPPGSSPQKGGEGLLSSAVESSGPSSRSNSPVRSRLAAVSVMESAPVDAPSASSVPLDPLGALRSQYDSMVNFLLTVQNILDAMSSSAERLQALCNWSDPVATGILVFGLLGASVAVWVLGLQWCLAALILFDLRPPLLRDPWPPPPINLLSWVPSRADHMG